MRARQTIAEEIDVEAVGNGFLHHVPDRFADKVGNFRGVGVRVRENDSAVGQSIATIINAIRVALERTPPELSADISDRGIVLTGGGALIKNLDKRIREETGLPVSIADDPLASVVLGTGQMLNNFKLLRKISID